jgi:hypothetical protein
VPVLQTESRLRVTLRDAGFAQVDVVDETRFTRVLEARV